MFILNTVPQNCKILHLIGPNDLKTTVHASDAELSRSSNCGGKNVGTHLSEGSSQKFPDCTFQLCAANTMTTSKKDLFLDLEFYGDDADLVPLSMGAPGPEAMAGCKELLMDATKETLVS